MVVVVVAGGGIWLWKSRERAAVLQPDWEAVTVVIGGDGVPGMRDGDPARARFSDPFGIAAAADGAVFVADAGDAQRIRRIASDGVVATLAGGPPGFADGAGSSARFNTPSGIALDANGIVYVADTGNNAIRRISPDGLVSTVAGGGGAGYRDGAGQEALFNGPVGIAVDASGRVIVADTYNDRIRGVTPDGTVVTIAGAGQPGAADGPTADARFDTPCGVAVDAAGNLYVADTGNDAVRMIALDGVVSTIGPLPADGLVRPIGIVATPKGILYVTDDRGRIVEITPGVRARTLAGSRPGYAAGAGTDARFRSLAGLSLAAPGRLVVADTRNALIRFVSAPSRMEPLAATRPGIDPRFDGESFASTPLLWPLSPMEGPFEITGTLGESRGGEGSERLHAGIDIHATEGTFVNVVRDGMVSSPISTAGFGTLNESMRIGPIAYVHFRVGRERRDELIDASRFVATYDDTGRMVQMRVKRGARFSVGEPIGTVNAFNHVHLNVGWPSEEHNPLDFRLMYFQDTIPPRIARRGVRLFGEDGQLITQRKKGRLLVDGRVQIVVDAWDQVNGNERRRRLGLYRLGYQVLNRDGSPAPGFDSPRETIRFDRFAGDDAARLIYATGSGIPVYGRRSTRFLYVVTNTLHQGVASADTWDTALLPPGDYVLRILAEDSRGNQAVQNRDVPVTVVAPPHNPATGG